MIYKSRLGLKDGAWAWLRRLGLTYFSKPGLDVSPGLARAGSGSGRGLWVVRGARHTSATGPPEMKQDLKNGFLMVVKRRVCFQSQVFTSNSHIRAGLSVESNGTVLSGSQEHLDTNTMSEVVSRRTPACWDEYHRRIYQSVAARLSQCRM